MPEPNTYFNSFTDDELQRLLDPTLGVRTFSPMGQQPFNTQDVTQELQRRRIWRTSMAGQATPEQIEQALQGNVGVLPPSRTNYPDDPEVPPWNPTPPSRPPLPPSLLPPEGEPYSISVPPPVSTPGGEQFGPPVPSAARQPAGGARRGSGGVAPAQPLPTPPVPPGNEMFGPDASLAPTRDPAMSARDQNKWLAVLQAGLGMLAADGPNAAANIGKGGMAGVAAFQDWEKTRKSEEARDRQLDIMDEYRKGTVDVARQNADTRIQEAQNRMLIAEMNASRAIGAAAQRQAANELDAARLAYQRERDEASRRQRENERDPAVRAQQQWTAQRAQIIERAMAMKDEMGRPMFATPEALNRYVDGVVGPQPGAVPRAVRDQLRSGYDAFMNGSLPADKWNEMLTGFRRSFNVDPNIYLRD